MKMKNKNLLDLYSDYGVSAFGQTTVTGLGVLLKSLPTYVNSTVFNLLCKVGW